MPSATAREALVRYALANPDWALRELDRVEGEASLLGFVRRAWHVIEPSQAFIEGKVIGAICEHLEAVSRGEILRLLINVPPGFSKSLLTGVFWPAWEWGPQNRPATRFLGTSYSQEYAIRDSGRMRNLVSSEWYQAIWGDRVQLVTEGVRKFETSRRGWREAVPFSRLTGGRGDRVIIDDPLSVDQANSQAEREHAKLLFLEALPTRLNDPERSAIVVIMQRLHEEDTSGVILSKDLGYDHLMLPMEYDSGRHCVTSIGFEDWRTQDGELLFPERFPRWTVDRDKATMTPYAIAGQFQQSPEPRGGGIFKRDWWKIWDPEPDQNGRQTFPNCDYVVASLDPAYTTKEENDYSALTVWGRFRHEDGLPKLILMGAWQARLGLNDLVTKVGASCRKFSVDRLLIESKASGISVAQEMRRLYANDPWGVELIDPKGADKTARAYAVQHLFSDGMIYAPDKDWADMVQNEMASFPRGAHDDLTDSVTQALRHLRSIGLAMREAEIAAERAEQVRYKGRPKALPYGGI
jgi:predicted phage terminase large subunit-like protein